MADNIIEMHHEVVNGSAMSGSTDSGERSPLSGSATEHTVDGWSDDVELVLQNLLDNCNKLQREHKKQFILMESTLKYFRIPLIILSSINSVFSVGLTMYFQQSLVSTINCLISLICACISSVELFLNIHKSMESSFQSFQSYQILGIKISTTLKLEREHRDKNSIWGRGKPQQMPWTTCLLWLGQYL